MSSDNWQHRSSRMCCGTCMWWLQKLRVVPLGPDKLRVVVPPPILGPDKLHVPLPNLGRCRKNAPTLDGWPAVWDTDWCGEHKLDENRV